MKSTSLTELKAHLSTYLRGVRLGEEVIVCIRGKPVARIVPYSPQDYSEQEQRLIARGVVQPPLKRRRSVRAWPKPPGNVPQEAMDRIWQEERDGR